MIHAALSIPRTNKVSNTALIVETDLSPHSLIHQHIYLHTHWLTHHAIRGKNGFILSFHKTFLTFSCKVIISEDFTLDQRSGVVLDDSDNWVITETDPQTWTDGSYYPVLPKLNAFGKFDESLGLQGPGNTPFGDRAIWNEDDIYAYITNSEIEDDSLLIDIEPEEIERNIFNDRSGNDFVGIGMSDYKVRFDTETVKPTKNKFISRITLGKTKDGAF